MKNKVNRLLYILFITVGLSSLFMEMYMTTVALLGLSIFLDPFNPKQSWREKPHWQKAVFVAQGTVVIGLFIPQMISLWNNW
jgi:hypothetical protein